MPPCSCSSGTVVAAVHHGDGLGERPQRPHRHRAVVGVRAEDRVGVAVASLDDEVELVAVSTGNRAAGRLGGLAGSAHAVFASGVQSSARGA